MKTANWKSKKTIILGAGALLVAAGGYAYLNNTVQTAPTDITINNVTETTNEEPTNDTNITKVGNVEYVNDQLVVQFNEKLTESEMKQVLTSNSNIKNVKALDEGAEKSQVAVIDLESTSTEELEQAKMQVSNLSNIANVEYNYLYDINEVNDPYSYSVPSTNEWGEYQGHYNDAKVSEAWAIEDGKSNPVTVAVIDTGVNFAHEDLANVAWVNSDEIANNGIDDDKNGYVDDINGANVMGTRTSDFDIKDRYYHGSHLAGTIAAEANNSKGGTGVSQGAKIMAVKVSETGSGITSSDLYSGVQYAVNNGADVVNISLSGFGFSAAQQDAFINATNVVFACSAGNNSTNVKVYPASYNSPNIISVGAIDSTGKKASYSNFGSWVDIMAPGSNVLSVNSKYYDSKTQLSDGTYYVGTPKYDAGYAYKSGTSMATPHVAGVLALMKSETPELKGGDLANTLLNNSTTAFATNTCSNSGATITDVCDANNTKLDAYKSVAAIQYSLKANNGTLTYDNTTEYYNVTFDMAIVDGAEASNPAIQLPTVELYNAIDKTKVALPLVSKIADGKYEVSIPKTSFVNLNKYQILVTSNDNYAIFPSNTTKLELNNFEPINDGNNLINLVDVNTIATEMNTYTVNSSFNNAVTNGNNIDVTLRYNVTNQDGVVYKSSVKPNVRLSSSNGYVNIDPTNVTIIDEQTLKVSVLATSIKNDVTNTIEIQPSSSDILFEDIVIEDKAFKTVKNFNSNPSYASTKNVDYVFSNNASELNITTQNNTYTTSTDYIDMSKVTGYKYYTSAKSSTVQDVLRVNFKYGFANQNNVFYSANVVPAISMVSTDGASKISIYPTNVTKSGDIVTVNIPVKSLVDKKTYKVFVTPAATDWATGIIPTTEKTGVNVRTTNTNQSNVLVGSNLMTYSSQNFEAAFYNAVQASTTGRK